MAGRGVDIKLGGDPEGLAERDCRGEQLEEGTEEWDERYADLLNKHESQCTEEGKRILELGGLYVLGTERHESRRIDNQLRGRSGRQGDPGESRFYLSLEDDLMRLFATGAMNYVMDRALPDDVPIEAKMVTKAIERAQNTVEAKNAEARKNVLKYDEVMNEQRKVIYQRRANILEGEDLRDETIEAISEVVDRLVETHASGEHPESWDVDSLETEVASYWPTELDADRFAEEPSNGALYETLAAEAIERYEDREEVLTEPVMRQVERQIMMRLIDQRWRDHLYEMDYLREGIHLRAMGQRDPATEWQREGFEMFGQMMSSINSEFARYIMHVEVKPAEQQQDEAGDEAKAAPQDSAPTIVDAEATKAQASTTAGSGSAPEKEKSKAEEAPPVPKVNNEFENVGRNAPCPCGSGKKFKHCHGR